jgi:hypothetical protein
VLALMHVITVAPLLAVFLGSVVVVVGWPTGLRPFWPVPDLSLSEAVLTRDAGEIVRLIERVGVNPNRPWPIRYGLAGAITEATPLEAAVLARRADLVRLLVRHGAVVPEGQGRMALICRGVAVSAPDIVALLLAMGDRTDPRDRCPSIEAAP